MQEGGRWVTIKGRHVYVREGQSVMDAFIRQETNKNQEQEEEYSGEFVDKTKSSKYVLGDDGELKLVKSETDAYFQRSNGERIEMMPTKDYNAMKKQFYDSLTEDEKRALYIYMSDTSMWMDDTAGPKIEKMFEEKAIPLEKDTLLYRRSYEDYQELKDGYTREGVFTSTSAYDKLPKTMPSGKSFGDKELYIIAPEGTKVLPIEDVGVKYVASDDGEKKIFARQHEILLPKNKSMELVQDVSTFEKKGFGDLDVNEKFVVKLSDNKYPKTEYKVNDYYGDKEYVFGDEDDMHKIRLRRKRNAPSYSKISRNDLYEYNVFELEWAGENGTFGTFEEARDALKKHLKK